MQHIICYILYVTYNMKWTSFLDNFLGHLISHEKFRSRTCKENWSAAITKPEIEINSAINSIWSCPLNIFLKMTC